MSSETAGSSPRMRGTRYTLDDALADGRFIPAHAGNTSFTPPPAGSPPVHPRACGEHRPARASTTARVGSSPRMRGTHQHDHDPLHEQRFIPAHAGNTQDHLPGALDVAGSSPRMRGTLDPLPCRIPGISVHPRACGEHSRLTTGIALVTGSSPRMRGTRCRRSG